MADRSRRLAGVPLWVMMLAGLAVLAGVLFVAMHVAGIAPVGHTM